MIELLTEFWPECLAMLLLTLCVTVSFPVLIYRKGCISYIVWYFVINWMAEIVSDLLAYKGIRNLFIYHFVNFADLIILFFFFFNAIQTVFIKRFVLISFLLSLSIGLVIVLQVQGLHNYPSYLSVLRKSISLVWALLYIHDFLKKTSLESSEQKYIYSFVILLFSNYFVTFFAEAFMKLMLKININIAENLGYLIFITDYIFEMAFIILSLKSVPSLIKKNGN